MGDDAEKKNDVCVGEGEGVVWIRKLDVSEGNYLLCLVRFIT